MTSLESGSVFREQRAAQNQALFREVNERIEPMSRAFGSVQPVNDFVCECAFNACTEQVALTIQEYERVREHPTRFAVRPEDGHVWPDVERVVEKHETYWIVEKAGKAAVIAAKVDPRSLRTPTRV